MLIKHSSGLRDILVFGVAPRGLGSGKGDQVTFTEINARSVFSLLLPPSCCYRKERAKSRRAPFPRRSASSLPSGGLRPAEWVGEPGILARGTCIAVDILY